MNSQNVSRVVFSILLTVAFVISCAKDIEPPGAPEGAKELARVSVATVIHSAELSHTIDFTTRLERGEPSVAFDPKTFCIQEIEYREDDKVKHRRLEISKDTTCPTDGSAMDKKQVLISLSFREGGETGTFLIYLEDGTENAIDKVFGQIQLRGSAQPKEFVLGVLCGFPTNPDGSDPSALVTSTRANCQFELENRAYKSITRK